MVTVVHIALTIHRDASAAFRDDAYTIASPSPVPFPGLVVKTGAKLRPPSGVMPQPVSDTSRQHAVAGLARSHPMLANRGYGIAVEF